MTVWYGMTEPLYDGKESQYISYSNNVLPAFYRFIIFGRKGAIVLVSNFLCGVTVDHNFVFIWTIWVAPYSRVLFPFIGISSTVWS